MKNKRGFLLGEFTLKVVVAVICLVVLIFLVYKVYSSYTERSKLEHAQATMNLLIERIAQAEKNGQSDEILREPKGWVMYYFKNGEPDKCGGESCLCICSEGWFSSRISECNSLGICGKTASNIVNFGDDKKIKIEVKKIIFKREQGGVSIELENA